MEFLSNLWTVTLLPLLTVYGSSILFTILAAVGIALSLGVLIVSSKLVKPLCDYLEALAEKNLSEKVSKRVNDAINKVESVLIDMITIQQETLKKMASEAYQNDGKIDMDEIKAMAHKMAEIALERLTPETSTIKKYLSGDAIFEYVKDKITAIITQSVESFLEKKLNSGKR